MLQLAGLIAGNNAPLTQRISAAAPTQQVMWTDYKKAPNLMVAEMWKNLLEGEGLPAKIIPEGNILDWSERVPFRVLVPKGREHVADEIIRKL